ncbi:ScbR family autoregulator-binding transcription factor [Frigoribacterium sp. 2-23]|uniref:ScbR family autoregulator-binding transcription factor n=1 Tax=Frigoribacterium sp. 2-23 TaxID=3415006 RepID=UPI003C6FD72B
MARQNRALATRASILKSAALVFDERGYAGTTLDSVAELAGVTKGALYFHFSSKEEVASAVIAEQHQISRNYAEAAMTASRSALEAMMLMCRGLAVQLIDEPLVSAGIRLTTDSSSRHLGTETPYADWMATFENLLTVAKGEGAVRASVDPAVVAHFIIPAYTGVQMVSDVMTQRGDLFSRLREMWQIMLPGLVPDDGLEAALDLTLTIRR